MRARIVHLFRDDAGQDLIEYALLAAFIGVAGVAMVGLIQTSLGTAYVRWGTQTEVLTCMPDPGGTGCP